MTSNQAFSPLFHRFFLSFFNDSRQAIFYGDWKLKKARPDINGTIGLGEIMCLMRAY